VNTASAAAPAVGWMRRLWTVVRPFRRLVALALGSAMVVVLAGLIIPLTIRHVLDLIVDAKKAGSRSGGVHWIWLVALLCLGGLRAAGTWGRRWYGGLVSIEVEAALRRRIHDHLQSLDPITHGALAQGQVVSRANSDISTIAQFFAFAPLLTSNVVLLVFSVVVMATLSPILTLVSLAMVPLLMAAGLGFRKWAFPASLDAQNRLGELATRADEAIAGVRVVKGFGQERRELLRFEHHARNVYSGRLRAVKITAKWQPLLAAIPALGVVATLALGGELASDGKITIGTFLAFVTYLQQIVAPIRFAALIVGVAQSARAGTERIFELLDGRTRIADAPGAAVLPPGPGAIELRHVDFSYVAGEPVLRGVNISIAAGERVAFVGGSGSGKSTAALLVPRFFDPVAGTVLIDGVDASTVTLESLRQRMGIVFEDPFLFSSSVRENIAFGDPDASLEQVVRAATLAGADEFIRALPNGYDTVVGEQGLTLSGGQRQRVGLARALLADPQILVLDDATSALDVATEATIHEALGPMLLGRTVIVVAHRRSTLRLADRVVVLDRGEVIDTGTHDELMSRCATYRLLLTGDDVLGSERTVAAGASEGSFASSVAGPGIAAQAPVAPPPMAMGGGFGGPGMGGPPMGGGFAPSPGTLERVALLPPATQVPPIDANDAISAALADHEPFSYRWFVRPFRIGLAGSMALVILDAMLVLAGPALVQWGIEDGVEGGDRGALRLAAALFFAVVVVNLVVVRAQTIVTGKLGERLLYRLRLRVFAQLQRLSLDFYERELSGRILTRVTNDVEALANLVQQGLLTMILNVLTLIGVSVLLLVRDVQLGLVAIAAIIPLIAATVVFRRVSSKAYSTIRDRVATVNASLAESFAGVKVTQAFARERRSTSGFSTVVDDHRKARMAGQRAVSFYFPIVEFLSVAAPTAVLAVGSRRVGAGEIGAGALVAFVLYLNQFFSPVQQLTVVFDTWQQAGAAASKISGLLSTPTMTPEADRPVSLPADRRSLEAICAQNVHFGYVGSNDEALRGVDVDIKPGETVALVGATGAGKSTLMKLIARYYDPTVGVMLAGGTDLRSFALADWRSQLGVVPQEPVLFTGSVAENIAYGRPDATREQIEQAAASVGAAEFVSSLPNGFDTPVSARGKSLSAGQRQLLALARAQLVEPRLLLLDEATANLDLATEGRVREAMGMMSKGRTTVLIAHRLDSARAADRVIVLADGRVVEVGHHDQLLQIPSGVYAALWALSEVTGSPKSLTGSL
jgi:ATP-binding cassette, subfamily B, bacterial